MVDCNFMEMTGQSRVKLGFVSAGPGRPCGAWKTRRDAEARRAARERSRLAFNGTIGSETIPAVLRAAMQGYQQRENAAELLGMSRRAAENLGREDDEF